MKGVERLVVMLYIQRDFVADALHLAFKQRVFFVHDHQVNIRTAANQRFFCQDGTGEIHGDDVVRLARFLRDVLPGKLDQ